MRGGTIPVKGNAGYRAGIHMKAYRDKVPRMVIGGTAGSFLGEYQAGGVIAVPGLGAQQDRIVGNFPCAGMHGGKLFVRCRREALSLPEQVTARPAQEADLSELKEILPDLCAVFPYDLLTVLNAPFTVITPDSANPYRRMYAAN